MITSISLTYLALAWFGISIIRGIIDQHQKMKLFWVRPANMLFMFAAGAACFFLIHLADYLINLTNQYHILGWVGGVACGLVGIVGIVICAIASFITNMGESYDLPLFSH